MQLDIHELTAAVQQNCHISDARYARDYTLCIYLLKMREYYRWEKGIGYEDELPADDLGNWLHEREQLWQRLESQAFRAISVAGQQFDPFDSEAINRHLTTQGLVYSGGLGRYAKPHFFIGTLLRKEQREGLTIFVSSRELARDLVSQPAMSLGRVIYVRRESIRRMIWEKIEEWRWRKQENAMARAVSHYDLEHNLRRALDEMTDHETEAAILHEIGEERAGQLLGEEWQELLAAVSRTKAEALVRAVRDHLADCVSSLPLLLTQDNRASLHFYFANLAGMRKELFPQLGAAYQRWINGSDLSGLADTVDRGREHWLNIARRLLELYRANPAECATTIEEFLLREHASQAF